MKRINLMDEIKVQLRFVFVLFIESNFSLKLIIHYVLNDLDTLVMIQITCTSNSRNFLTYCDNLFIFQLLNP